MRLLKMAAEQGHGEANAVLGHIYETGGYQDMETGRFHIIVKKNVEKALQCYAAAKDNELALNFLGAHAYNVLHNEEEAVRLFRKAA
jgi:TPR repeat protein